MPQVSPLEPGPSYSVTFALPAPRQDEEVAIPAPGAGQLAAALRLDPRPDAPPESGKERVLRLVRQARIIFGPAHAHLVDVLTLAQVSVVTQALYLAGQGIDPTRAVEWFAQSARQQQRDAAQILADVEVLVADMATRLKLSLEEAGKMPVGDALQLRDRLVAEEHEQLKTAAALHGMRLS